MQAQRQLHLSSTRPFTIAMAALVLLSGAAGGYAVATLTAHPQTVTQAAQAPAISSGVVEHSTSERNDRANTAPLSAGVVESKAALANRSQ